MHSVNQLLDEVKWINQIKSDYKLAQFLNITPNTIANYRHGRSRPDDKTLFKLAELANMEQEDIDVLAVRLHAERSSNQEAKEFWNRIIVRLQGGIAHPGVLAVLAAVSIGGHSTTTEASTIKNQVSSVYYVNKRKRYGFWSGLPLMGAG